jgi:hypothetical protein
MLAQQIRPIHSVWPSPQGVACPPRARTKIMVVRKAENLTFSPPTPNKKFSEFFTESSLFFLSGRTIPTWKGTDK